MNARDELSRLIASQHTSAAVDAILAAGYRKPLTIENDKLVIDGGMLLLDVESCTCTPYGSSHEYHCGLEYLDDLTKPLERAGYSKPRTITTAEELDALPAKSVILDPDGTPWVGDGDTIEPWASVCEDPYGGPIWKNSSDINLPATVLYEPQP